jgi:hypothetical protein
MRNRAEGARPMLMKTKTRNQNREITLRNAPTHTEEPDHADRPAQP